MILSGSVTRCDSPTRSFKIETNCYHVHIYKIDRSTGQSTGEKVFSRTPNDDKWLDEAHKKITNALSTLEQALLAVCHE